MTSSVLPLAGDVGAESHWQQGGWVFQLHTAAQNNSVRRLFSHGKKMISQIASKLALLPIYENAGDEKDTNRDYPNRVSYSLQESS